MCKHLPHCGGIVLLLLSIPDGLYFMGSTARPTSFPAHHISQGDSQMRYLAIAVLFLVPLAASADSIVTVTANEQFSSSSFSASYDYDTTTNALVANSMSYKFTGALASFTFQLVGGWGASWIDGAGNVLELFFRDHLGLEPAFPALGTYDIADVELSFLPLCVTAECRASASIIVTDPPDAPATPEPGTLILLLFAVAGLSASFVKY